MRNERCTEVKPEASGEQRPFCVNVTESRTKTIVVWAEDVMDAWDKAITIAEEGKIHFDMKRTPNYEVDADEVDEASEADVALLKNYR